MQEGKAKIFLQDTILNQWRRECSIAMLTLMFPLLCVTVDADLGMNYFWGLWFNLYLVMAFAFGFIYLIQEFYGYVSSPGVPIWLAFTLMGIGTTLPLVIFEYRFSSLKSAAQFCVVIAWSFTVISLIRFIWLIMKDRKGYRTWCSSNVDPYAAALLEYATVPSFREYVKIVNASASVAKE